MFLKEGECLKILDFKLFLPFYYYPDFSKKGVKKEARYSVNVSFVVDLVCVDITDFPYK